MSDFLQKIPLIHFPDHAKGTGERIRGIDPIITVLDLNKINTTYHFYTNN